MFRNWTWRVGVSMLGLLAAVALQGTTFAQAVGQNSAVIQGLRSAHQLLIEADHDYDGHRAKAAEEVHKAIHELEGKHGEKKIGTVAVAKTAPKLKRSEKEAQAMSDGQLNEALRMLNSLQSQMPASHPKAAAHVSKAIQNLKIALSIK